MTTEAQGAIQHAEKLLYLVGDPVTESWLKKTNESAQSLYAHYKPGVNRLESYGAMIEEILEWLRRPMHICAAFYGHPGVFTYPSHEAIRRARAEGFHAYMLPGISSEDCLFADLGIDPGASGIQSYEATDFLVYDRRFDLRSYLVLWQVGLVGVLDFSTNADWADQAKTDVLVERLRVDYGADHEVIAYEASQYPVAPPMVERAALCDLADLDLKAATTLVIPPGAESEPSRDVLQRLGIEGFAENDPSGS